MTFWNWGAVPFEMHEINHWLSLCSSLVLLSSRDPEQVTVTLLSY